MQIDTITAYYVAILDCFLDSAGSKAMFKRTVTKINSAEMSSVTQQ